MRRVWMIVGVLGLGGLVAISGAPLLLGAAMVSPALVLALAMSSGWYPGAQQIERLQDRRGRWAPRRCRAVDAGRRRLGRPSPFREPHGPLLGVSLAVRPPPA